MKKLPLLCLITLIITACGRNEQVQPTEPSSTVSVERISSSVDQLSQEKEEIERFMAAYVERVFDEANIDNKQAFLISRMSETALVQTAILEELEAYRHQVKTYQQTKQLSTSSSLVLVERKVLGMSVTQVDDDFQVRVTYQETSPAVAGSYKVNKVFLVTLKNKTIEQIIEK